MVICDYLMYTALHDIISGGNWPLVFRGIRFHDPVCCQLKAHINHFLPANLAKEEEHVLKVP